MVEAMRALEEGLALGWGRQAQKWPSHSKKKDFVFCRRVGGGLKKRGAERAPLP
jgi:hypothetical protein